MTLSIQPKSDFLRDKTRSSSHADLMASPQFQEAAKSAMLQLQYTTGLMPDASMAGVAIGSLKLKGAQEFLHILLNLGNPEPPRRETQEKTLNPV